MIKSNSIKEKFDSTTYLISIKDSLISLQAQIDEIIIPNYRNHISGLHSKVMVIQNQIDSLFIRHDLANDMRRDIIHL
jgi:hypothetical protein